jgi:hypothetical protein
MVKFPLRQSKLTLFALHHPVWLTAGSALVAFAWGLVFIGDWRAEVGAAGGTALIVGYLWSPKGWGRKFETSLYDETGELRNPSAHSDRRA